MSPRGTMDEVSSHVRLDLPSTARPPERLLHPVFEPHHGRASGADSGEKHEPAGDIDTAVVASLEALDPGRPIREADIDRLRVHALDHSTMIISAVNIEHTLTNAPMIFQVSSSRRVTERPSIRWA